MVVPRAALPMLDAHRTDLIRDDTAAILELIAGKHLFIPRPRAEISPEFKQIIPYVVIRGGGEYFLLRRLPKQGETRLHDKLSLGIGGHINPGHDLLAGLRKELEEEVSIDDPYELSFVGILNDDSTEVGRVHLGAVYMLETSRNVRVRETEKMTGSFVPREALGPLREAMESWSQIVHDRLIA
ncbi:MAG TPA: NUDIX domain-containing protein [Thermoanaerobaculia bacterium]|nr:NUDIX domain-containing protein [Thermoanaerobaculia bacterium]